MYRRYTDQGPVSCTSTAVDQKAWQKRTKFARASPRQEQGVPLRSSSSSYASTESKGLAFSWIMMLYGLEFINLRAWRRGGTQVSCCEIHYYHTTRHSLAHTVLHSARLLCTRRPLPQMRNFKGRLFAFAVRFCCQKSLRLARSIVSRFKQFCAPCTA